ncbi:hypothetical protein GJ496_005199 [Pomphorhynchus laevis]|nr:hypothetical protein GJ496_005199 [Pomphorhynchus laevis]
MNCSEQGMADVSDKELVEKIADHFKGILSDLSLIDKVERCTPDRAARALIDILSGYKTKVGHSAIKIEKPHQIVVIRNINFGSLCEHHLLPFTGQVSIAYIPSDHLIGVSKLIRIVNVYSRRLQLQEKLSIEIGEAINGMINPLAVGVCIRAMHTCVSLRGVRSTNSEMETTYTAGLFKEQPMRFDFLNAIK